MSVVSGSESLQKAIESVGFIMNLYKTKLVCVNVMITIKNWEIERTESCEKHSLTRVVNKITQQDGDVNISTVNSNNLFLFFCKSQI